MTRFLRVPFAMLCLTPLCGYGEVKVEVEKIVASEVLGGLVFWANNPDPWPVTGTVTGTARNMHPAKEFPYVVTIGPETRQRVATLQRDDFQQACQGNVLLKSRPGNPRSRPNPRARYKFPFRSGESYKVAQSFHGEISHTGKFEFAVDFQMPVGTVICAARSGTVVKLENDFQKGAWDPALLEKANLILILHDDGTLGFYGHLQYHGATVSLGQKVNAGDPIGHSGRTGMIREAHLHFHVELPIDGENFRSVPFKFEGATQRAGIEPEKDKTYTAP